MFEASIEPSAAPAPTSVCSSSINRMILALRVFDFLEDSLQSVFKFAAIFRAREHGAQVERHNALVLQNFGHIAGDDTLRQAFDDGRLAHARLPDQHRIILGRRESTCTTRRISSSRPITGSSLPRRACSVRSRRNARAPVLSFRILVGDALRSSNRGQSLQDGVVGSAVTSEQLLCRIALQTGQRQQHVLVETYSSLKVSASLKDFSRSWLTCDDMDGWFAPLVPETLGNFSISL